MSLRPIFYDTETTGISAERDRVIELAAYDPVKDKSFVQLINPECPIPPEATAIHHITDEMVASEPNFNDITESFVEFCQGDTVL
ncbi:MAG: DNA polymerase-3 subunit epsilon, partial [Chlamydiales bacterium]